LSVNQALTLRSGGNNNPNLAVLTGSLKIDGNLTVNSTEESSCAGSLTVSGDLTVNGKISGKIDTSKITSGVLAVDRIPSLSANKISSGSMTGNLSIKGNLTIGQGKVNLDGDRQIRLVAK
jgi:cytoskeletal protein CcmA (bactofilin family)